MKVKFSLFMFFMTMSVFVFYSLGISKPDDNGLSDPGCSGGNCHNHDAGIVSTQMLPNMQIEVTLIGVTAGQEVAGELIDENGNVVDVENSSNDNPFILTAPANGKYLINAGYRRPSRLWDSTSVVVGSVTGIDDPAISDLPQSFELYPNHPNPFNPETQIRFTIPQSGEVKLTVYNINGQVVRTLTDGFLQSGLYAVRWDGRNDRGELSPSGIYIYEVINNGKRQAKEMVLAK